MTPNPDFDFLETVDPSVVRPDKTPFKDFFTSGKGLQVAGAVLQGFGGQQRTRTGLSNTYAQVQSMYNRATSNREQANMQDYFTHLENESMMTAITKALSKQTSSFKGRGIGGGATAEAIRRSSKRALEKQRSAKHLVGSTRSFALRRQAERLISEGQSAVKMAQSNARSARRSNFLSTAINVASLFAGG